MLDFQLQQFPFRLGLAEGTDPRQVPPGTLLTAENCVWKQAGRVEKRFGVTALASVGASTLARLFTRGAELCATDGTSLYAYSSTATAWKSLDQVPDLGLTWETLIDTNSGVNDFDQGLYGASTIVSAWTAGLSSGATTSQVFCQVTDTAGSVLRPPTRISSAGANGIRVVVMDGFAHVIFRIGANIVINPIDMSTYAPQGGQNLRTDAYASGTFYAVAIGSTLILAYENSSHALKFYSYTYSAGTYTQTATGGITGETGSVFNTLAIDATAGESLYIVYGRTTPDVRMRLAVANPSTLAQTVAPVDLEVDAVGSAGTYVDYDTASVRRLTSTSAVATWSTRGSSTQTGRASSVVCSSTGTVTATSARGTWGARWLSPPFFVGSRLYAAALDLTTGPTGFYQSPTSYLAEIETSSIGVLPAYPPHRYVGMVDPLIGGGFGMMPTACTLSSTKVLLAYPYQASAAISAASWRCGVRQVTVTSGADLPSDVWRSVTVTKETYLVGATLSAYDGRLCFDYGSQRGTPFSGLASAGGSMAAGNYLYAIVPEYRSAAGMLHRGPTFTLTAAITVAASGKVTLTVSSISVQSKADVANGGLVVASNALPQSLAVYRTTVGGSTLQRLTLEPNNSVITDNPSNFGQTYIDTVADASIDGLNTSLAQRPALYTTGGILDDYAPPASVTMFHHADRLWTLAGDQRTWWYSKAFQDDAGTAPGFNPGFRIIFDDVQTAGATMDDKAIFFSATGVRYMLGSGPAANGQNSDFTPPVVIQSDVGCTNARSVVGTPDGVMFLSDRGLYLLTRGLELVWIGRPVKDTLAAYPNVTSAVLVAKQNQVRFTCNATGGASGVVIVYDYVEKQWSTSKYYDGTTYGCAIADACMWNGAWTFATPGGLVFTESTATNLDNGTYVPMTLETAWISAAGPLAFQSVRTMSLHGTNYTDYNLAISVGFDNDPSYPQVATFLATTPATTVGDAECDVIIGTRRKCGTIRFKIADTGPSAGTVGTGRGPGFDMMALEVGMKKGPKTNPATKRA